MADTRTADDQGMTLERVGVAQSARIAINFDATTPPTEQELTAFPPLPTGYTDMGLLVDDGGYAPEIEAGDQTPLYQKGYFVQTGEEGRSFKLKFAEISNPNVRKLIGIVDNVQKTNFWTAPVGIIIATRFANSNETNLYGGIAQVKGVSYDGEASTGEIRSAEVEFSWNFRNEYCGYNRDVIVVNEGGACS